MDIADHDPPAESLLSPPPPFRDRGTAIQLMGLFVVLIGLGCFGMVALVATGVGVASAVSSGHGAPFRSTVPAVLVYLVASAFFVATGIGSVLVRRWARALLAVTSWMWLAVGGIALVLITALLPKFTATITAAAPPGTPAPPAVLMVGCMMGALIVIFLALPLPLALFYSGRNVRATFEARDRPRWTDRLPTPLLGLFLVLAYSAVSALELPLYGAVPAFGKLLSGPSVWVFALLFAAAAGAGAAWVCRRSILGWWMAVALWFFGSVSSIWTFAGGFDWNTYYVQMGLSQQQIQLTRGLSPAELFANPLVLGIMALAWFGIGAVLFWTKKFFPLPEGFGLAV